MIGPPSSVIVRLDGINRFRDALLAGSRVGIERVARQYVAALKLIIQTTGPVPRLYHMRTRKNGTRARTKVRAGRAGDNIPSKPGEPPAHQMGMLRKSFSFARVSDTEVKVGTNVKYARPLEFGHVRRNGKWTAERPFMRPTMKNPALRRKASGILSAAVLASVRRAASGGAR